MQCWIIALVLAALQPCAGFTHLGLGGQTVAIDGNGVILAADGTKVAPALNAANDVGNAGSKKTGAGLVRQEGEEVGHTRHRTMLERRQWSKTHGNLFATHRLMQRSLAWTSLLAVRIPSTVTNSILFPIIIGFLAIGFAITIFQCVTQMRQRMAREAAVPADTDGGSGGIGTNEQPQQLIERDFNRFPTPLDQDIYGMGIAALIRDMQRVALGSESRGLRLSRMMISLLTLIFTMTLQVFLLVEMKHLVTSVSTNDAQDSYEKYEIVMYGNDTAAMDKTADGQLRGVDANFDMSRFARLDDEMKGSICQVPLSQPTLFIAILLVWTLVCTNEIRNAFDLAGSLLYSTPTISDMKDSIKETEREGDNAVIVVGLTLPIKIAAVTLVIVPRITVTATLLWLGCRWLTGTLGLSDVLQNAVALEFILLLKYVFYDAITPNHNKKETVNTMLQPFAATESPSKSVFLGAFTWGIVSVVWVFLYVLVLQQVLPDYQWDIHDACVSYLAGEDLKMEDPTDPMKSPGAAVAAAATAAAVGKGAAVAAVPIKSLLGLR